MVVISLISIKMMFPRSSFVWVTAIITASCLVVANWTTLVPDTLFCFNPCSWLWTFSPFNSRSSILCGGISKTKSPRSPCRPHGLYRKYSATESALPGCSWCPGVQIFKVICHFQRVVWLYFREITFWLPLGRLCQLILSPVVFNSCQLCCALPKFSLIVSCFCNFAHCFTPACFDPAT